MAITTTCMPLQVSHFDTLHDKETKFHHRKRAFEEQQRLKQKAAKQQADSGDAAAS